MSHLTERITINGAWATLAGSSPEILENCLRFKEPNAIYSQAFIEGRWDGLIKVYSGMSFPSGLVKHVCKYMDTAGIKYTVTGELTHKKLQIKGFDRTYLPGIELWEHQVNAVNTILETYSGVIQMPTGSGKSEVMVAAAKILWESQGWKTLVVVPKKGILTQTVARFKKYYGDDIDVGQCGDSIKTFGTVTVATAQTLSQFKNRYQKVQGVKRKRLVRGNAKLQELLESCKVLFIDECHHAKAETWYDIGMKSNAIIRYGFSGTPMSGKLIDDVRLIGVTGDVTYQVGMQHLVENDLAPKAKIVMVMSDNASGPKLEKVQTVIDADSINKHLQSAIPEKEQGYKDAYKNGIVENEFHNNAVIRSASWLVSQGRHVLVFCRMKKHFRNLTALMRKNNMSFKSLSGDNSTAERLEAKHSFECGDVSILLATTIFDEGVDINGIDALVFAEGVKSFSNNIQRLGRGMRMKRDDGGDVVSGCDVWVVDFVPLCHDTLAKHAEQRAAAFEQQGHEVVVLEEWPEIMESAQGLLFESGSLLPFKHWDEAVKGQ